MYKKFLAIIFVMCMVLPAYAKRQEEEIITPMTQLQKRNFQTRTYSSNDKVLIMKSLLNVFQDEGYMVYNVNSLLGFIYSVKDFDTTDPNVDISKEFGYTKSRLNYNGIKVATVESVANVTEYGDNVRVRVNFKRKLLNEYGNAQLVEDIDEAPFYDEFYSKVDNALNLQKQTKIQPIKEVVLQQKQNEVKNDKDVAEDVTTEVKEEIDEKIESPYFKTEDILYEEDKKEQAQKEKLIQKEEKEKAKIQAKELKEQERLSKEQAKEQAREAKEQEKEAKEQEKLSRELAKEQEKQSKQEAKIIKQMEKLNQ